MAFLEPVTHVDLLFVINRVVDVAFILDFFLQFFLMVQVQTKDGLTWLTQPWPIAMRYFKGWFVIDVLAIAVSSSPRGFSFAVSILSVSVA